MPAGRTSRRCRQRGIRLGLAAHFDISHQSGSFLTLQEQLIDFIGTLAMHAGGTGRDIGEQAAADPAEVRIRIVFRMGRAFIVLSALIVTLT